MDYQVDLQNLLTSQHFGIQIEQISSTETDYQ